MSKDEIKSTAAAPHIYRIVMGICRWIFFDLLVGGAVPGLSRLAVRRLAAALRRLLRVARGDFTDDKYAARFPKFDGNDSGETPQQLFEAWVAERKPARSSVESWRYVFAAMTTHFKDRSARSITP